MAMLAEPRRKQKVINLRAKNTAWSNDANKFGQRMLEKMGWSAGKGLGAKENGIVEHVVARYKNDDRGLGFEDKNDQWTKHEDDFNALLANLSNSNAESSDNLHSGISLEDKSKKSKSRIHYHKFTRGKDLSKYSEKDLANIFGKKSFKNKKEMETSIEDDTTSREKIFTEKGSMEDYFKSKMASIKSKNKFIDKHDEGNEDCDYVFQGFSCTDDHMNSLDTPQLYIHSLNDQNIATEETNTDSVCKKKKKKKKHNSNDLDELICNGETMDIAQDIPKKTKKIKNNLKLSEVSVDETPTENGNSNEPKKKKKKKNKNM
ncbi:PIN2/TERF1-interacting telomerase inhibitor 1 [Leptidea sinapis]|uniref:PIN2/TERF1-interacting telomerase inhibitor 1 n=1 Tax=Leptidea sinapis TaxID=189913 RepID=UPI00213ADE6E|nr:PIN2/TERF1-interacting telomerase inhibitor 1 [Leptidea sinapis]